jgi:hypothetical protein
MRLSEARRSGVTAAALGVLIFLVLACLAGGSAREVLAHGGGTPRLVDEPVGPYRLYVWTKPDPVRVGTAHITAGVFTRAVGSDRDEPVLDASVGLVVTARGGGEAWHGEASQQESTNKLYYEADVAIRAEGEWQVTVNIGGPAGEGSAQFDLEAKEPGINWMPVGGVAVIVIALGWWLLGMRRKEE